MLVTLKEKKTEAIARMKMLKLHENPIREFEKENKLNLSEHGGMLYWLSDEQKAMVKDFEEENNALVYHVIHNYMDFGELLTFLYVSDYKEEWKLDRNDLKQGYALAYVKNIDDDFCSEFGSVEIKPQFGGLVRIS